MGPLSRRRRPARRGLWPQMRHGVAFLRAILPLTLPIRYDARQARRWTACGEVVLVAVAPVFTEDGRWTQIGSMRSRAVSRRAGPDGGYSGRSLAPYWGVLASCASRPHSPPTTAVDAASGAVRPAAMAPVSHAVRGQATVRATAIDRRSVRGRNIAAAWQSAAVTPCARCRRIPRIRRRHGRASAIATARTARSVPGFGDASPARRESARSPAAKRWKERLNAAAFPAAAVVLGGPEDDPWGRWQVVGGQGVRLPCQLPPRHSR